MRFLSPIKETSEIYEKIMDYLADIWRKEIYVPLMKDIVRKSLIKNAYQDLVDAISSGQIQYIDAHFEGSFSSAVSRELKKLGAVWDRKHGWWTIPQSKLTNDMRMAIGTSQSRFQSMSNRIVQKLNDMIPADIAEKFQAQKLFDMALHRVNGQMKKQISVMPELTKDQSARISKEYVNNMQLYIKDWTEKEILELRNKISENSYKGNRYEDMVKIIQDSYGVSRNKAKFLARQETSLMITKFQQTRYQSAGVNEYKWRTVAGSPKHPVRTMHKALDGKIFTWDNPPIVDEKGNRKNPGQDYNCRCTAVPIVRF